MTTIKAYYTDCVEYIHDLQHSIDVASLQFCECQKLLEIGLASHSSQY